MKVWDTRLALSSNPSSSSTPRPKTNLASPDAPPADEKFVFICLFLFFYYSYFFLFLSFRLFVLSHRSLTLESLLDHVLHILWCSFFLFLLMEYCSTNEGDAVLLGPCVDTEPNASKPISGGVVDSLDLGDSNKPISHIHVSRGTIIVFILLFFYCLILF